MNYINEHQIQDELAKVEMKKPHKFVKKEYPFSQLTEKEFELLLYVSFRKNGGSLIEFDDCHLVGGSGDQGRDIILVKNGKTVGVIQCKKYETLITRPQAAKEIIKFVLHALQQPRIYDLNNLTYFFVVSKGFNSAASSLLEHFPIEIENEANLKKWIGEVQNDFKRTTLDPSIDFTRILEALKSIKFRKLLPHDIGSLMDEGIIGNFFAVEKVIDVKAFQEMLIKPKIDLSDFMNQYRVSQRNIFSRINFFGLAITTKPREVPFENLFVKPTLRRRGQMQSKYSYPFELKDSVGSYSSTSSLLVKDINSWVFANIGSGKTPFSKIFLEYFNESSQMKPDLIQVEEIFKTKKNVVILGKPGAGKSSLVKYLMIYMLSKSDERLGIPFRVELHKYNQERKQNSVGFIDYIFNQLQSEHQIHKITRDDIVDILTHHKAVIFFDGMDEVLDVHERISVRNDIENISELYKNLKCVVTSRFESYDEVNLKEQQFEVFEVNDFDDNQVKDYVQRWYGIEETDSELRRKEVGECLREINNIEDELKRNPLLLTLILILYRNELELPTSKLDVYEGCTLTLVDTRDRKEKKLGTELLISNKIATFSSLAYWQNNKMMDITQPPVTYTSALLHVKNYLLEKGEFEFEQEADEAAQSFLNFAFIRSIYVENTFTHKTFLEYFTANYLYNNFFSKGKLEQLHQFISNTIASSSWHVVIELLICKIDKAQGDFTVIDEILERQLSTRKEVAVLFFLSILKYLQNISPGMINRLFKLSIRTTIQGIQAGNKSAIARAMNSHLMELSKSERFAKRLTKMLDQYEENISSEIQDHSYNVFILENGVFTSRYIQIISDDKAREKAMKANPYIFTILAVPQMTDVDTYGALLKEYVVAFNERDLMRTYRSKYGSNIFFGSNSFHWITTFLFSKDYERFVETALLLMKNGFNKIKVIRAIKQDNGQIQITHKTLLSYLDIETHKARKEIILAALKNYYGYDEGSKNETEPFYKRVGSSKRRFPVPR